MNKLANYSMILPLTPKYQTKNKQPHKWANKLYICKINRLHFTKNKINKIQQNIVYSKQKSIWEITTIEAYQENISSAFRASVLHPSDAKTFWLRRGHRAQIGLCFEICRLVVDFNITKTPRNNPNYKEVVK